MLISHKLRRNAEGTQITLVYKVQFLCGPPSFLDGHKNMTDTTDIFTLDQRFQRAFKPKQPSATLIQGTG